MVVTIRPVLIVGPRRIVRRLIGRPAWHWLRLAAAIALAVLALAAAGRYLRFAI
jgi:hypothetical protein